MKKISYSLIILFTICFNSGFSQKCEVTKDPITNETITSFNFKNRMVYYEHQKGVSSLEMLFTYGGELNVTIPKGTELLFKLESGEILKLVTANDAIPKSQVVASQYSASVITYYSYLMQINKETMAKLAGSPVVLIRFPNGKGGQDDFIPKGRAKKISSAIVKGAQCMMGYE